jgi:hypothetical protein
LIRFDLRFHSKTHRAKDKTQFRRLDPEAIRLVALAKEQLALITENGFHGTSFRLWLKINSSDESIAYRNSCRGAGVEAGDAT